MAGKRTKAAISAAGWPIASSLLLLLAGASFGEIFKGGLVWAPVGLALFGIAVAIRFRTESPYRKFRNLGSREADRREVLVLALSPTRDILPPNLDPSGDLGVDLKALAEHKRAAYQNDQRAAHWNWEQGLRAVYHHSRDDGPLRRVVLLGSPQSVTQFHQFVDQVARKYPELDHVIFEGFFKYDWKLHVLESPGYERARQNGFDFQDFEVLTQAYDKLLAHLSGQGVSANQVQVDFTGGQKPTSVVAAVVTLFSRATNQYVMTNPEDENAPVWDYPVLGYDFREVFEPVD